MPPTPRAPISWGELIDKITILEIKSVEILNPAARANVLSELELLQAIAGTHASGGEVLRLKQELKAVNSQLWKIEDAIREKERQKDFGEAFVQLARAVYQRNDERSRIKKLINKGLRSEIVEEKIYRSY